MAREEKAVFTNMCMITDDQGNVLVQDKLDPGFRGLTFPGGHVEPGESFVESVIREVREETGLTIEDPVLCGIKQFPTESGARYVVLFFKASKYSGHIRSSEEGLVYWLPRQSLPAQKLAPDMLDMIRVMESENLCEFMYYQENGIWKYTLR